jgi:hypothetical protein
MCIAMSSVLYKTRFFMFGCANRGLKVLSNYARLAGCSVLQVLLLCIF